VAEEIEFEKCNFWNFRDLITLEGVKVKTLTPSNVIRSTRRSRPKNWVLKNFPPPFARLGTGTAINALAELNFLILSVVNFFKAT